MLFIKKVNTMMFTALRNLIAILYAENSIKFYIVMLIYCTALERLKNFISLAIWKPR